MIKLIASDMDGTLLDDSKNLPADFYDTLDRLNERGIRFTVASGRTYYAVEHIFRRDYVDSIDFICDNGAYIMHRGKPICITPLAHNTFERLIAACSEIGGLKILVCAEDGTYHLDSDKRFTQELEKFYPRHIVTDNLLNVKTTIYKIAICDEQGAERRAKPAIDARFGDELNVQVSGEQWMDVMAAGVCKGSALAKLGGLLGVSAEETMAFGDYYNDAEMLEYAAHSFWMENGRTAVKACAKNVAENNNSGGVTKAIRRYALNEVNV